MTTDMTVTTRRELVGALRARYQASSREDKTRILQEFITVSGYHRKSAIRILNGSQAIDGRSRRSQRPRVYDEAVRQALLVLWEVSDRVCGKRLKALIPVLLPALERHGHLELNPTIRDKLTCISAASIDRLLRDVRGVGTRRRPKRKPTAQQRQVPIRTFADWPDEPQPGYMEIDLLGVEQAVVSPAAIPIKTTPAHTQPLQSYLACL